MDCSAEAFSSSYVPDLWNTIPLTMSQLRGIVMYSLDAVFFFWIFSSTIDTMVVLKNKNQTRKLEMFKSFRLLVIVTVIASTCYNIFFESLLSVTIVRAFWKTEWL